MKRPNLLTTLLVCSYLGAFGCEDSSGSDVSTGTETNWLKTCDQDTECGDLSCECGVCTSVCDDEGDCTMDGAYCSSNESESVAEMCGASSVVGLCLRASDGADDDGADDDGADDDGADDDGADDDQSSEPEPEAPNGMGGESTTTDDDSPEGGASNGVGGSGEQGPAAGNGGGGSSSTGGTSAAGNASGGASVGGSSVGGTGGASMGGASMGGTGGASMGGASMGGAGGASMGGASNQCDFDSCHPERCDEPGEPCCDPYPGDGANYCNDGLTCLSDGCQHAETTTPEAQALAACEASGGSWDYQSCGDYVCGLPPACTAIIAGCNCGYYANFESAPAGCQPDLGCMTAGQDFGCGDQTCSTLQTQYCEEFTSGPGITTLTCQDIPEECLESTGCDCLIDETLPLPPTCRIGPSGERIVVPPPVP